MPGQDVTASAPIAAYRHPHLGARFCPGCGAARVAGLVCCEMPRRLHPRTCTGVVAFDGDDRILLVRRDIEPRRGLWQVPGGFMELGETTEDGARRELREEVRLELGSLTLLGVFSAVELGLIVICYEARALGPATAGHEVQEVGWFAPQEVPWCEISFTSSELALHAWLRRHGHQPPARVHTTWGG